MHLARIRIGFAGALLAAALALGSAAAQEPEREHLPRRSKPPPAGVRPVGLPAYDVMIGVPAVSDADRQFDRLVDEFLLVYFRARPVHATAAGLHDYDALFPATDSAGIDSALVVVDAYLERLGQLDVARLGHERQLDHAVLAGRLRREVRDLRTSPTWRRDPGSYVAIVSEGIRALVERDFAPLEDRTWNVIARLTATPGVFRDARANLRDPPRAETEIAIERAAGLVQFLSNELPPRVAPLRDPVLGEEFDHHLASAVGAVAEYRHWLKTDVLPRSAAARGPTEAADSLALLDGAPSASRLDSLLRLR